MSPANSDAERVSNLLLEAQLLRAQGQTDAAADRFAAVAELEEQLAETASAGGDRIAGWQHRFSAVGCWVQAGNFYAAIALADELLADPQLQPDVRNQVQSYAAAIRARRDQWAAGLSAAGAAARLIA